MEFRLGARTMFNREQNIAEVSMRVFCVGYTVKSGWLGGGGGCLLFVSVFQNMTECVYYS